MSAPVTLIFRHLPRSGALESSARDIGNRLKKLCHGMTTCHIVFEGNAGAAQANAVYQVKIHLSVPGAQIHAESLAVEAANPLRSAYENARRQLVGLKRMQSRSAVCESVASESAQTPLHTAGT
jgi:hypothetical protein